jgi:2-polyprenyl-3-methyl-5-hydroxy-6-metoxy-1,4-benzoquinol methylase
MVQNLEKKITEHDVIEYWSSKYSCKVQRYLQQQLVFSQKRKVADEKLVMLMADFFRNKRVIDVGAGVGRMIPVWKILECDTTLVDRSDSLYKVLSERAKENNLKSKQIDISKERVKEKFDIAFATQVLLHIPPNKIKKAVANMARMAEWLFIITWQNKNKPYSRNDDEIQSFNHHYQYLFNKLGLEIYMEMNLVFPASEFKNKERQNIVFIIHNNNSQ